MDIETLGTGVNSVILSIGACYFDPSTGEIGPKFNEHINVQSCVDKGLEIDPSTVLWWMGQEDAARNSIIDNQESAISLQAALNRFGLFVDPHARIWGNGATFDNTIVKNAYDKCGTFVPWKFWNDRDVRTIVELGQQMGFDPKRDIPFEGIQHDALADAIHQAKYVSAIWQRLGL